MDPAVLAILMEGFIIVAIGLYMTMSGESAAGTRTDQEAERDEKIEHKRDVYRRLGPWVIAIGVALVVLQLLNRRLNQ